MNKLLLEKTVKKTIAILFLLLPLLATQARKTAVFKFDARSDRFMLSGNEAELDRLYQFVEQYKTQIQSDEMPLRVDGYCASMESRRDNLKTAKTRASRVKSELITNRGLKEEHFKTAVHAETYESKKDVVLVTFILKELKDLKDVKEQPQPEQKPAEQPAQPRPVEETQQTPPGGADMFEQPAAPSPSERAGGEVSIRTNLLYWAAATPNLGIEYKPSNSIGILVNGAYSHWIWKGDSRHHRTWLVQPEIRYYLDESKHWFLGIEGHIAQFNLKFGGTGYQGDALGGGITGGYRLQLSKCLDMDFSLGFGYTSLKYDTYYRSNDVMVRRESNLKKNVFAPTQAGVSLIFKL